MKKDDAQPAPPRRGGRGSLAQELSGLDEHIARLIARRTRLYRKASAKRRSKGLSVSDPGLEKGLWPTWDRVAKEEGLSPRLLRRLFSLVNTLGIDLAERGDPTGKVFELYPRNAPARVDQPGPTDSVLARIHLAVAAASGQPARIRPVLQNDPLIELVKALNQAGARVSWEEGVVEAKAGGALSFEGKTVYAGSDPLNLFLLMALACLSPGRTIFTGQARLKALDLGPLGQAMPGMGARLVNMEPGCPGLPARIESGAGLGGRAIIGEGVHPMAVQALAAVAWATDNGLALEMPPEALDQALSGPAVRALKIWGVEPAVEEGALVMRPSRPENPEVVALPLDPALCAYILAAPFFIGGQVRFTGVWQDGRPETLALKRDFKALGLELAGDAMGVRSAKTGKPEIETMACGRFPGLFPLALALGLGLDAPVTIPAPAGQEHAARGEEFLDHLGASYRVDEEGFIIRPGRPAAAGPWHSPDPFFTLAMALAAFRLPGSGLHNPGEVTALWPGFWQLYNAVSSEEKPGKDEDEQPTRRRRVRIKS